MATARGFRTIKITFKGSPVSVYASPRIAGALADIEKDMAVFAGVKLHQVMEAVYNQGVKDGRNEAFNTMDRSFAAAKKALPHRRPGRPSRRLAA